MHNYLSRSYASANENGQEEIVLERHRTIAELAWAALSGDFDLSKTVVKRYVRLGLFSWVEKDTGIVPNEDMQLELSEIELHLKQACQHEF